MNIAEQHLQRLQPRSRKYLKRAWIAFLFIASLWLVFVGGKLLVSTRLLNAIPDQFVEEDASDNSETRASIFDSFFTTRFRLYDEIRAGENLFTALTRLKVSTTFIEKFSQAIGKATNLRQLLPGDGIMVETASPNMQLGSRLDIPALAASVAPRAIELFSKDASGVAYSIRAQMIGDINTGSVDVEIKKPKVHKEHSMINGAVASNIYGSIVNNGGDAQLVNSFSDIFAWQFDFYKDTRAGDTYQMIVERNVSEGRFVNYGRVLAAEYVSSNKAIRGFYFESSDGQVAGFFDDKGLSLKNAFLKAPLKLASITSSFGMRYHPVQKVLKAHRGVDYGAMRGTPFMAVASGVVINAGYSPFNGNWVRLRHMNGYETEYLHATHLAKGVRVGAHIKQGQVIGYVGKTGLATGYHLHFGMKKDGAYVNPSAQKFARTAGIPPKYLAEFNRSIEAMVIALNRQGADSKGVLASNE